MQQQAFAQLSLIAGGVNGSSAAVEEPKAAGPALPIPQRLQAVLEQEGNKICAECPETSPTWACLLANPLVDAEEGKRVLGVLCCFKCYGAHFQLGNEVGQVKSTRRVNDWKEEEIIVLENSGNAAVNAIYESKLTPEEKRREHEQDKDTFIKNKYQDLLYFSKKAFQQRLTGAPASSTIGAAFNQLRIPPLSLTTGVTQDGGTKQSNFGLTTPTFDWVTFSKSGKDLQGDASSAQQREGPKRGGLTKAFSNPFTLETMRREVLGPAPRRGVNPNKQSSSTSKLATEEKKDNDDNPQKGSKKSSLAELDLLRKAADNDNDDDAASVVSSASRIRNRRQNRRNLRKVVSSPKTLATMRKELATARSSNRNMEDEDGDKEDPLSLSLSESRRSNGKRRSDPEPNCGKLERSKGSKKPASTNNLRALYGEGKVGEERPRELRSKRSGGRNRDRSTDSGRCDKSPKRSLERPRSNGKLEPRRGDQPLKRPERTRGRSTGNKTTTEGGSSHHSRGSRMREGSSRSASRSRRARREIARDDSKSGLARDESNRTAGSSRHRRQLSRDGSARSIQSSSRRRAAAGGSAHSRQVQRQDSVRSISMRSAKRLGDSGGLSVASSRAGRSSGGGLSRYGSERSLDSASTLDSLESVNSGASLAGLSAVGIDVERRPTTQSHCSNSLLDLCPDSPDSTASESSQDLFSAPITPNLTPTRKRSGQEPTTIVSPLKSLILDELAVPDIDGKEDDNVDDGCGQDGDDSSVCSCKSKHSRASKQRGSADKGKKKCSSRTKRSKTMNSPRSPRHDSSPSKDERPNRRSRNSRNGQRGSGNDKTEKTLQDTILALQAISSTSVVVDPRTRKVALKRANTID